MASASVGKLFLAGFVPGILTADPKAVPDARLVPQLHHREAAEVAYFGLTIVLMLVLARCALGFAGVSARSSLVLGLAAVLLLSRPGEWNLLTSHGPWAVDDLFETVAFTPDAKRLVTAGAWSDLVAEAGGEEVDCRADELFAVFRGARDGVAAAVAAADAVQFIGMPEGRIPLAEAVTYLGLPLLPAISQYTSDWAGFGVSDGLRRLAKYFRHYRRVAPRA